MMNRWSSRSLPPGSRLMMNPNAPRPQKSTRLTAVNARTARALSSRRNRQMHTNVPIAASTVNTGQRV